MPLPWSEYCDQMPPLLGLFIFTLLLVNIDQIPSIWGIFLAKWDQIPTFHQWGGGEVGQYTDGCITSQSLQLRKFTLHTCAHTHLSVTNGWNIMWTCYGPTPIHTCTCTSIQVTPIHTLRIRRSVQLQRRLRTHHNDDSDGHVRHIYYMGVGVELEPALYSQKSQFSGSALVSRTQITLQPRSTPTKWWRYSA